MKAEEGALRRGIVCMVMRALLKANLLVAKYIVLLTIVMMRAMVEATLRHPT